MAILSNWLLNIYVYIYRFVLLSTWLAKLLQRVVGKAEALLFNVLEISHYVCSATVCSVTQASPWLRDTKTGEVERL